MAESINSRVGTSLLCHYRGANDIFPIGGVVQPGETLTAATIRHCRHLVNFRIEHNDRLYIATKSNECMDHEPIKITICITNVLCGRLRIRNRNISLTKGRSKWHHFPYGV